MKLKVLVDNNTICKLRGEWGLSFYIEDEDKKILLDLGYSDLFMENARQMNIDLMGLDYIAISHGHYDHVWGMEKLIKTYRKEGISKENRPKILAHPLAFLPKINNRGIENGALITEDVVKRDFYTDFNKEPIWITDKLVFLGEIERKNDFEGKKIIGKILKENGVEEDYILDDTSLAYKIDEGIIVITGCSHSGICNIVEHAKKVCKDDRVVDIIGGFHLHNASDKQVERTVQYMNEIKPKVTHPCHCTGLKAKIALSRVVEVEDVGVGLELEY